MQLKLPNLGAVDRSRSPRLYLIPTRVTDPNGNVEILLNPVGGPYGPLPSDPAWFPDSINPRTVVCHILRGYAATRCMRAGGYF
jgi:hypothetical protein